MVDAILLPAVLKIQCSITKKEIKNNNNSDIYQVKSITLNKRGEQEHLRQKWKPSNTSPTV